MDDSGTTPKPTPVASDPFDQIYHVVVTGGNAGPVDVTPLPPQAQQRGEARIYDQHPRPPTPKERIQPKLLERIQAGDTRREEVLLNFVDHERFPPYPYPRTAEGPVEQLTVKESSVPPAGIQLDQYERDTGREPVKESIVPPAGTQRDQRRRDIGREPVTGSIVPDVGLEWIAHIHNQRRQDYDMLLQRLEPYGVNPNEAERFWVVRALRVSIDLTAVPNLIESFPELLYVELCEAGERPPQVASVELTDDNSPDQQAIDELVADVGLQPLFPLTHGRIALLDTGVAVSSQERPWLNTVLQRVVNRCDCVLAAGTGDSEPCNPNATVDEEALYHGTYTAAVLTANSKDRDYLGATQLPVDSYTVYRPQAGLAFLRADAAVRALETIIASGLYTVVVASMQGERAETSTIASTVDRAFDEAGLVVIAANGNTSSFTTVPANAKKAIGVGAVDLISRTRSPSGSWGTSDGRVKPDVQGPTDYRVFPPPDGIPNLFETSGATPVIGAAAALLRDWLGSLNPPTQDAGQVYAHLILSGQLGFISEYAGAGPVRLEINGSHWWGKHEIHDQETITIDLPVQSPIAQLDVAVWWAEAATNNQGLAIHNRINLFLQDPTGQLMDPSNHAYSVFQRLRAPANPGQPVPSGTWRIVLQGDGVPAAHQTIYWAAVARPNSSNPQGGPTMTGNTRGLDGDQNSAPTPSAGGAGAAASPTGVPDEWYEGSGFNPGGMIPPWLGAVSAQGWHAGHVVFLQGYVGPAPDSMNYFRLYRDPGLQHYLEIPIRGAVVYAITYRSGFSPLGLSYLWIKADTPIVVGNAQSTTAHLLNGPISQEYGGDAQVWNSPGGRPGGMGGPSFVPGCAPSSSCGSPVCPH